MRISRKVSSPIIVNICTASINLLVTTIIVRIMSLELIGEYTIFLAKILLINLLYIILPPNYILVKLQDDNRYIGIYNTYYMCFSIINIVAIIVLCLVGYFKTPIWLTLFFILTYIPKNYFDVTLVVKDKLVWYYALLLFESIGHLIFIGIIGVSKIYTSLNLLILGYSVIQLILFVVYFYIFGEVQFCRITQLFEVLKNDWKLISSYYLCTACKKLKDTCLVLLFEKSTTASQIGIFSIYMKSIGFVLGLARSLEAMMVNRINNRDIGNYIKDKFYLIGILLQILIVSITIIYVMMVSGYVNYTLVIMSSFLIYPYLRYIPKRAAYLLAYNNRPINIGYVLFIVIVFVSFFAIPNEWINYESLILIYLIAETINYIYVWKIKKTDKFSSSKISY